MSTQKKLLKPVTLAELEKDKATSSVWVINKSAPKGNVNMTMSDGMGNTIAAKVPVTWIPIDLTTQAAKNNVLSSPIFRRMVSMGIIGLVSEESAVAFMEDPEAQKEAMRVYSHAQQVDLDQFAPVEAKLAVAESSGDVGGFALQLAMAKDLDEDQVMTTLRNNESNLTRKDLQYIAENSTYARVKVHCADLLVSAPASA